MSRRIQSKGIDLKKEGFLRPFLFSTDMPPVYNYFMENREILTNLKAAENERHADKVIFVTVQRNSRLRYVETEEEWEEWRREQILENRMGKGLLGSLTFFVGEEKAISVHFSEDAYTGEDRTERLCLDAAETVRNFLSLYFERVIRIQKQNDALAREIAKACAKSKSGYKRKVIYNYYHDFCEKTPENERLQFHWLKKMGGSER